MQANISRSGHHLGFTLIEVLVALSIMALMALMTWRGIDGMARAQEATRQYTDDVLALQAGLGQWRADLDAMMVWQQAVNTTNPSSNSSPVPQEVNRSLTWDGNTLRITRLTAEDAAAGVRVVAWTRRASTGQWLRWQSPPSRRRKHGRPPGMRRLAGGRPHRWKEHPQEERRRQPSWLRSIGSCTILETTPGRTRSPADRKALTPPARGRTAFDS
ncbi:PulJ/GspJ family protein [Ottowia caeni]|uniref:PulJ/GspJ family protein n=1 Tax=Ottowia caeni TaxID=2870339 RepID=UPI003D71A7F5